MLGVEFSLFSRRQAFSLVEVVIALGIVAFVLVAILGLLPIGLRQTGDSEKESRGINILGAIASDRASSDAGANSLIYQIPALTLGGGPSTNTFFVKENGEYLGSDLSNAYYRVSSIVYPPEAGRLDPWKHFLRLSWPAGDTNGSGSVEMLSAIEQ